MNECGSMSKRMSVSKNSTSIKRISFNVPRPKSAFISGDNDYNSKRILKRDILRDPSTNVTFSLSVRLWEIGEKFVVHDCHHNMRIRELKNAMEIVVGIPTDFQRVCYLDKGDLQDETTFHYNDIIPGTAVSLMIWPYNGWAELVIAAATGDIFQLKRVMSKPEPPCSCHPRPKDSVSGPSTWLSHRLFSALFICAHRGHLPAVRFLLQCGADVKGQTPLGRGALHVAAAQGQVQTVLELLEQGSPVNMEDADGLTALRTAVHFHQKKSARQLFLFHWQERAKGVRLKPRLDEAELFAHQKRDSRLRAWYQGVHAQKYMAHPGTCSRGEGGNAGPRKPAPPRNAVVGAQARSAWMGHGLHV
ncbi:ankyrin repeat domain-containing protein 60 isoform X2 [Esox lucius]|uniref:Ankyrin repeat domain 60 n=2 Tax=Esox lucius TaxID=8010 RepID=A0AAY5K7V2_ESOLU|nr:ankyrin repeat domain-containing protein 60 isoform X2 [Esox lucius]